MTGLSNGTSSEHPVTVSLEDLKQGNVPFSVLEDAFGPASLGIIVVKDLPSDFKDLRARLLSYSSYLANLPPDHLRALESPKSKYLVGWSLGKETLKSGSFDTLKGSYYVNCAPAFEKHETRRKLDTEFPDFQEYTAPNVWPGSVLPGFEETFRELCNLIIDVAVLVARACDQYAEVNVEGYQKGYLEHVVKSSVSTKARLLHYFPPPPTSETATTNEDDDDWCATHLDHGCLTGLTSAAFIDEAAHPPQTSNAEAPTLPELSTAPDSKAGLYIHSRSGTVTKVSIPRDCLAFQTGQALEVITEGKFKAVPHFVRGAKGNAERSKVARNTLAVFTQPNLWEKVDAERTFADFARGIVAKNTAS